MYECKKLAAQKTIEKKEAKLKEIHMVIHLSPIPPDNRIAQQGGAVGPPCRC